MNFKNDFFKIILVTLSCFNAFHVYAQSNERAPEEIFRYIDTRLLCSDVEDALAGQYQEYFKSKEVDFDLDEARLEAVKGVCSLPTDDVSLAGVLSVLQGKRFRMIADPENNILSLYAQTYGDVPRICCSIQRMKWRKIGERYWVARLRLRDMESGKLKMFLSGEGGSRYESGAIQDDEIYTWSGPKVKEPLHERIEPDTIVGKVETLSLYSEELGETRKIDIYTPPEFHKQERLPVIIIADGQGLKFSEANFVDQMIQQKEIKRVILIGVHSGKRAIVEDRPEINYDVRTADYSPNIEGSDRFQNHLAWVSDTLLPWAEEVYGVSPDRKDHAVSGQSNGGVFALHAGLKRPDVFGIAMSMSPGWKTVREAPLKTKQKAIFFISAGFYESYFLASATRSAQSLRSADYEVIEIYSSTGHADDQWASRFMENMLRAFPYSE